MKQCSWNRGKFQKQINPFVKFLMVGAINTLLTMMIIFMLMSIFGKGYWLSTFFGNAAGMVSSFVLNRKFTFRSNVSFWKGGAAFLASAYLCYFLSYLSSEKILEIINQFYFNGHLLYQKELSVLLGMSFYTGLNFIAQKYFVFAKGAY